jgi:hypothetical protein
MPYLTDQTEIASQSLPAAKANDHRHELSVFLLLLCIGLVTAIAYAPALGNFFNGDDFVHLVWLNKAQSNWELLLRNFHSAWLDVPTARFYRPLISCFMMADYLALGRSGLAFHLTNLICHLLSVVFLYLVFTEIVETKDKVADTDKRNLRLWRSASTALFALYPLHAEAVAWITGRVDTIVTMFFLASFWCYLRWRAQQNRAWLAASCLAFIASLLSKEMAIMLPPVLIAYEVILHRQPSSVQTRENNGEPERHPLAFLGPVFPFFLILLAYLAVRSISLGTAIGGYDDSLLPRFDRVFVRNILHSLRLFLFPFNQEALVSHPLLKYTWFVCVTSSILFGLRSWFVASRQRKIVLFMITWLLLLFVPVFKLLAISDDLQGSRLVYLPSAPLSALLCFGFAMLSLSQPVSRALKMILLAAMLTAAGAILYIHNIVWQQAGRQTQAIMQSLNELYGHIPGDPPVFLVGVPDTVDGAYVIRNAIDGMTKSPQLIRDIKSCHILDNFDRVFPFGMAKPAVALAAKSGQVLKWDQKTMSFSNACLDTSIPKTITVWSGTLAAESQNKRTRPAAVLDLSGLPCFNVDCLIFDVDWRNDSKAPEPITASLLYTNDLQKDFDPAFRADCQLSDKNGHQRLAFPLHSEVNWAMGGKCRQLKLMLPEGTRFTLRSVSAQPLALTIPMLSLANTANQYSLGYVQLNQQHPNSVLECDVSSIPEASSVGLEVTRPSAFFELHNSAKCDNNAQIIKTINGKKGSISLKLSDFVKDGIYEARLRTMNTEGKPFGFASDHIVISVNH